MTIDRTGGVPQLPPNTPISAEGPASAARVISLYEHGEERESHNPVEAAELFKKAIELGSSLWKSLGLVYQQGRGLPPDDHEADRLYTIIAASMKHLGWMYFEGRGVHQDDREAVRLYTMAAEKGDAMAMTNLGCMYQEGLGVPKNIDGALQWFRRGADGGDPDARRNLDSLCSMLAAESLRLQPGSEN